MDSVNSLTRQWLILSMIPRNRRIGTPEVRERLWSEYNIQTTLRTVQRDMVDLSGTFPLVCDNNRPAGWSWSKDAISFEIPCMDPLAALAFRVVRDSMTRMLPRAALASLRCYFSAADERLKKLPDSRLSHWPDKVRVVSRSLNLVAPEVDESVLDTVYEALQKELCFEVVYRLKSGKEKKYDVNPLGLVFVGNLIYLVATLQKYLDPVQLLAHRIQSIRLLDRNASTPEGFSLQGYIDSGEFGYPIGGMIKLKALFRAKTAEHLYESKLSTNQKLTEKPDGRILLEATVRDDAQLRWWLNGFGDKVEVVAPKGLRQEFIEMVESMHRSYAVAS
ncbi:MAG: WYL domain-containing protein [Legionella sp.]|uniref:helix-turn-helix transcriptional regulator n=1 Tax=Legionella sp. TaxID=459 RepID=UPI002847A9BE|nr:WYL domain-containing protein [Legionella sp.]